MVCATDVEPTTGQPRRFFGSKASGTQCYGYAASRLHGAMHRGSEVESETCYEHTGMETKNSYYNHHDTILLYLCEHRIFQFCQHIVTTIVLQSYGHLPTITSPSSPYATSTIITNIHLRMPSIIFTSSPHVSNYGVIIFTIILPSYYNRINIMLPLRYPIITLSFPFSSKPYDNHLTIMFPSYHHPQLMSTIRSHFGSSLFVEN